MMASAYAAPVPGCAQDADVAVVGAGIVGLAVARELLGRRPGTRVVVLERAGGVAAGQTGANSGVVHAGIYYAPGSLKARLCVRGRELLEDFCAERDVPLRRAGKLVVALAPEELERLDELERRGRANGVPGLRRLEGQQALREVEPHVRGLAALHSPATGVVDFGAVARALAADVVAHRGELRLGAEVTGAVRRGGRTVVALRAGDPVRARRVVFCAGAAASRLAEAVGAAADPRIVPFRGRYLTLAPAARDLVRGLIYPVPDPELPFLGIHLHRRIDGEVDLGPTALLAGGLAWPGTWRVVGRFWRTGAVELRHALSRRAMVTAGARYVPELRPEHVDHGWAGTRAQAVGRDGRLFDDFVFSTTGGALHVRNAPSPAATSALAIAEVIADRIDESP